MNIGNIAKHYSILLVRRWTGDFEREYRLDEKTVGTAYITMGFGRSGTSLLSELVQACGVYFGGAEELKGGAGDDPRNPHGFFEHNRLYELCRLFLDQAGFKDELYSYTDFKAKGFSNQVKRIFTRKAILRTLNRLSAGRDRWGLKGYQIFFYFLRYEIPRYKIIGIYRDPVASAHSLVRMQKSGLHPFTEAIRAWTESNKELLYFLATEGGMLVRYEDLFDAKKQDLVLRKIVEYVGCGDPARLRSCIDPALNRSAAAVERLRALYPLDNETRAVLDALEAMKVK